MLDRLKSGTWIPLSVAFCAALAMGGLVAFASRSLGNWVFVLPLASLALVLLLILPLPLVVCAIILTIPLDYHSLGPLSLSDAVLLVALGRFTLNTLAKGKIGEPASVSMTVVPTALTVLVMVALVSTLWARPASEALRSWTTLVAMVLLSLLVAATLQSEQQVRCGVRTAFIAAGATALVGLIQELLYIGLGVIVFPPVLMRIGGLQIVRITGLFPDPNFLALYLLPVFVLGVMDWGKGWYVGNSRLYRTITVLVGVACLLTFSRATLIILWAFLLSLLLQRRYRHLVWLLLPVALGLVIVVAPAVLKALVELNAVSYHFRLTLLQETLASIAQSPVWGSGLGHKIYVNYTLLPYGTDSEKIGGYHEAHNTFLQLIDNVGLVGGLAFLVAIGIPLILGAVLTLRNRRSAGRVWVLEVSFLFTLIASMSLSALLTKQIWVLFGLLMAAISLTLRERRADAEFITSS